MKKKLTALLMTALLLLVGCAKNDKPVENTETAANNVPEFVLAGTLKEDVPNIYLIVKSINKKYFQVMFDAAEAAAQELDCNVYYSGAESSSDWETQATLMDIAAKNGADAIILAPNDTAKLASKVNELYSSGIAIIFVDAVVNTNSYDACYMTDNFSAGQEAAVEMLTHLRNSGLSENEPAQIAIQIGRQSSQTVNERLAGFCQYWEQHAPASWTIIDDIKSNGGDDSKSLAVTEEFFNEYNNIRGVFGTNSGSAKGFAEYLSSYELKNVAIVGFDYPDEIAALLNDGSYMVSTMLQKQYDMSYKAIQAAIDIKNGSFSTDGKLIDTGVVAVNNQNMTEPEIMETIERN